MKIGSIGLAAAFALLLAAPPPASAQDKNSWDGLVRVESKKLKAVYLAPHADFRGYTKVMLDPSEVAFRKNWLRDQNTRDITNSDNISEAEARKILTDAQQGFDKIFRDAYQKAGYAVVTTPGPDVLRVRTAVLDLDIAAPDQMSAGISRTYSRSAGGATLVVEARDSVTNALLGRAADGRSDDEFGPYLRNRATNSWDFERIFQDWAKASVDGLGKLKELSPVDATGKLAKK